MLNNGFHGFLIRRRAPKSLDLLGYFGFSDPAGTVVGPGFAVWSYVVWTGTAVAGRCVDLMFPLCAGMGRTSHPPAGTLTRNVCGFLIDGRWGENEKRKVFARLLGQYLTPEVIPAAVCESATCGTAQDELRGVCTTFADSDDFGKTGRTDLVSRFSLNATWRNMTKIVFRHARHARQYHR